MRGVFSLFSVAFITGGVVWLAGAQAGDDKQAPVQKLTPSSPGAKPLKVKERLGGFYSAVSKLKNTDTRDGIGVRWNWPKELANKAWGAKENVALVAFPDEHVAFGKHRGMALRLINRTKQPVDFRACDSRLYLVQEARDDKGRWREIEDMPWSRCGNSYHDVALAASEYWEFSAPLYRGAAKTKIRFRLDASQRRGKDRWIYSNEFDGEVAKTQFYIGPTSPEVRRAFASKSAKEDGVVATLIELLNEKEVKSESSGRYIQPERAAEHLATLGPDASGALPALRLSMKRKGELGATAAYAVWRMDGKLDDCVKTLIGMLDEWDERESPWYAAVMLYRMGPPAKDAVPALCKAMNRGEERFQEITISALGAIRARADLAVPVLVKALRDKSSWVRYRAEEALVKFGAEAKPAIPQLIANLKDEDNHVKRTAAFALWRIEGNAERVMPLFMEQLKLQNRNGAHYAAEWLGEIGPAAKAAIPELTLNLKREDDQPLRIRAAGALWRITKQAEPSVSVLSKEFMSKERLHHSDVAYALRILEEMGGQAKAAIPALRASLRAEQDDDVRELLEKGLRKIDPEGAKKAGSR